MPALSKGEVVECSVWLSAAMLTLRDMVLDHLRALWDHSMLASALRSTTAVGKEVLITMQRCFRGD